MRNAVVISLTASRVIFRSSRSTSELASSYVFRRISARTSRLRAAPAWSSSRLMRSRSIVLSAWHVRASPRCALPLDGGGLHRLVERRALPQAAAQRGDQLGEGLGVHGLGVRGAGGP